MVEQTLLTRTVFAVEGAGGVPRKTHRDRACIRLTVDRVRNRSSSDDDDETNKVTLLLMMAARISDLRAFTLTFGSMA